MDRASPPLAPRGDTLRSVLPAGNRCHFVLLDKDESCPTADLSNIGRPRPNGHTNLSFFFQKLNRNRTEIKHICSAHP